MERSKTGTGGAQGDKIFLNFGVVHLPRMLPQNMGSWIPTVTHQAGIEGLKACQSHYQQKS